MIKNWKTFSTGVVMIVGAVTAFIFLKEKDAGAITAMVTAVLGGVGLVFAKDGNVTGGTVDQGTPLKIIEEPKIVEKK